MPKALVLFSGGLDSLIAIKLLQRQGIDTTALTYITPFFGAKKAIEQSKLNNFKIITKNIGETHFEMLKKPKYGYGKNMNPCIDCHGLMFKIATQIADEGGFDILASGEVLGQRQMSQNKRSLGLVRKITGREILMPLSAKLLEPTVYETSGLVDRTKLLDISGKSRYRQIEFAEEFNLIGYNSPGGGCLLTIATFAKKLKDFFKQTDKELSVYDAEMLKYGRLEVYVSNNEKYFAIRGRNADDNIKLEELFNEKLDNQYTKITIKNNIPCPTMILKSGNKESMELLKEQIKETYKKSIKYEGDFELNFFSK